LEASARADVAKERLARLDRGENVSGGLGKPLDLVAVLKAAGFTDREIQRCRDCALLGEIGAFEELMTEVHKRREASEHAAVRAVLKRHADRIAVAAEDDPTVEH
jgi:hypothetical protein